MKSFRDLLTTIDGYSRWAVRRLGGPVFLHCDPVLVLDRQIAITGWALSSDGVEKVEAYLGDVFLSTARYGLINHDIGTKYSFMRNSLYSGFRLTFSIPDYVDPGFHVLDIRATTHRNKTSTWRTRVDIGTESVIDPSVEWMNQVLDSFAYQPLIDVAIFADSNEGLLNQTIDSILSQAYPHWHINVFRNHRNRGEGVCKSAGSSENSRVTTFPMEALARPASWISGEFVTFLQAGDTLLPHALLEIVNSLNRDGLADLVYANDDVNEHTGTSFFKPHWSPELLLSMNYIGQFFALRSEIFQRAAGISQATPEAWCYSLLLRSTEITDRVRHINARVFRGHIRPILPARLGKEVLKDCLSHRGIQADVHELDMTGRYRVQRHSENLPEISIIIATAYKDPVRNIKRCLASILQKTSYRDYTVWIVDNSHGALRVDDLNAMVTGDTRLRIIRYDKPFNYAAIHNFIVNQVESQYVALLNDDTEVSSPGWLEAMLEHAQRPEVAVVGCKLLYEDDTVQHGGGVLLASYEALHAFRHMQADDPGYYGLASVVRNCSWVTFACVMISRELYLKFGGLDEGLPVDLNDVDFALKALQRNYQIVYTPHAVLYHRESASKRVGTTPGQKLFCDKWRQAFKQGDPYCDPRIVFIG